MFNTFSSYYFYFSRKKLIMITVEDFKSTFLKSNIVRPNRFAVYVATDLVSSDAHDINRLKFYAQSATIPDRTFNEIVIKYYGMDFKLAGGEVTQDLTISFIADSDWKNRNVFEIWTNKINNRSNSVKGYAAELFGDDTYIVVEQLGADGALIASYIFYNVFPKALDGMELNMETLDSVSTFQVTFSYSYWERLK